jgi:hypothetical protein
MLYWVRRVKFSTESPVSEGLIVQHPSQFDSWVLEFLLLLQCNLFRSFVQAYVEVNHLLQSGAEP